MQLFEPLHIRSLSFANRLWASPMCQYSAQDGVVGDWHLMHYGSLAAGKPGLIVAESTAVRPDGRISPQCAGLWNSRQEEAWRRIVEFVHALDVKIGIQLSHSGRKGSTSPPWEGERDITGQNGWSTIGPSEVAYGDYRPPREATEADLTNFVDCFAQAAMRANHCGFDVLEIHAAHGYLLHSFLSPLSNKRTDRFGGDVDGRMRFPLEVVDAVRAVWPEDKPLFVRISCTDWAPGGWTVGESILFARELAARGVDLIDCSSGGLVPVAEIPTEPDYQEVLARRVKHEANVKTAAVGRITTAERANAVIESQAADAVFLARALLRNPRMPLAAQEAAGGDAPWPPQYERASLRLMGGRAT